MGEEEEEREGEEGGGSTGAQGSTFQPPPNVMSKDSPPTQPEPDVGPLFDK